MPIDPNIALQGKPVQFDGAGITNALQHGLALRMQQEQHAQQMQLGAQQLQAGQQEFALRDQAMKDDQNSRDFFATNPNASPEEMIARLGPKVATPIIKTRYEAEEARLKTGREKSQQFGQIAASIKDESSFHQGIEAAASRGLIDRNTANQFHSEPWNEQTAAQIQQLGQQSMSAVEQHDAILKDNKERFDALMRPAQLEKEQNEARKTGTEADSLQVQKDASMLANAARQGPGALAAGLQQLSQAGRVEPFMRVSANSKPEDILALGLTPDQQVTTAQTAAHNTATEANEKRLREIAAGNLSVAQGRLKIEQDTHNQTYGPNANPALVGVEPHLRLPAAAGAQKITDEYGKAMDSAANMQTFLDAAKSGNKMAGSNLPIMGAESLQALNGIKRINRTEIEAYQGAGSLLDRIQGKIGKLTSGQPIPQDVINDIEALQSKLAGNATASANAKMDAHNGIYRSNFKLAPRGNQPAPANSGAPADVKKALSSAGPGIHTLSDGSKWMTAADGTITKQ